MYQHTQPGTLTRLVLLAGLLVLLCLGIVIVNSCLLKGTMQPYDQDALLRLLGIMFVLGILLLLFHNLTVSADHEAVRVAYGIGIIRRRILFQNVTQCSAVKNPWWWGFGIRLVPGGWLWNVSGLRAVELKLKSGRTFRIGTDEPEVLAAAIKEKLAAR